MSETAIYICLKDASLQNGLIIGSVNSHNCAIFCKHTSLLRDMLLLACLDFTIRHCS